MSTAELKAALKGEVSTTEPKALSPYQQVKFELEKRKGEFQTLLGSKELVERFVRVTLNATMANPKLLEADKVSLLSACMKAAQDGLMPDGREAVLNIFNTKQKEGNQTFWIQKVQYLPMVGGMIKQLYSSGEITYVDSACVYANDKFVYKRGDNPVLEHEPCIVGEPGEIVAAYAVIKLKNGETKREVMPKRDLDQVRNASSAKDSGPWSTWYDQMAIKSVLKRIYKQLPRADAFEKVAQSDNQALGYEPVQAEPLPAITEYKPVVNPFVLVEDGTVYDEQPVETVGNHQETKQASEVDQFSILYDKIMNATELDVLDVHADLIRDIGDEEQRGKLQVAYQSRRKEIAE